jgi:hypothetical protein
MSYCFLEDAYSLQEIGNQQPNTVDKEQKYKMNTPPQRIPIVNESNDSFSISTNNNSKQGQSNSNTSNNSSSNNSLNIDPYNDDNYFMLNNNENSGNDDNHNNHNNSIEQFSNQNNDGNRERNDNGNGNGNGNDVGDYNNENDDDDNGDYDIDVNHNAHVLVNDEPSTQEMLFKIMKRLDKIEKKLKPSTTNNIHDLILFVLGGAFLLFVLHAIFKVGKMTI